MNAKRIMLEDGTKLDAHRCDGCGTIYAGRVADVAEECCRCKGCQKQIIKHQSMYGRWCDDCWRNESARIDMERMNRAVEVDYDGGPVFNGDRYFRDMDELIEHYHEGPPPEFVYPCSIRYPTLDAGDIIENLIENMNVEDIEPERLSGVKEFDDAVKAFNEANSNGVQIWEEDSKKKVRVVALAPASAKGATKG